MRLIFALAQPEMPKVTSLWTNLLRESPHSPTNFSRVISVLNVEMEQWVISDEFRCCFFNVMAPYNTVRGDEMAQQTWSSPSPLLRTKEFNPRENVQSTGFFTASFSFTGAANAAAGIRLLPLPRLPFLSYEGAGNRCSHGQFGSALE